MVESLQGELRGQASHARVRARRYLETQLPRVDNDPYALSVTAWALTLSKSVESETAFAMLHSNKRESPNGMYWSRGEIPANTLNWENNRPFIQIKQEQEWDALSVETTAYAFRVYMAREAINFVQEKIVNWLNTMRMATGGFISMVDTLAAYEALTEYSWRTRLRDITDMRVKLEATATPDWQKVVTISNNSIAALHTFDVS